MDDRNVIQNIDELAREEHDLFTRESHGTSTEANRERLKQLEPLLDQCWDLLRQRRAKREFGQDPDNAHLRSKNTVESYSG